MKRLLIVLVALFTLAAVSCGSSGATNAATVNGTNISTDVLMSELEGYASNDQFVQQYEASGTKITGETEGSYDATFTAAVLSTLIVSELINEEVAARGLEITDEDRATAEAEFQQQFGPGADAMEQDFKDRQINALASRTVLTEALTAETPPAGDPTDEDVQEYYDANIEQIVAQNGDFACVSHILVTWEEAPDPAAEIAAPTPEQEAAALARATTIEARLAAGEDFATVATAESGDPGSAAQGGYLGCQPVSSSTYVPEFAAAITSQPVGEIGAPVKTEFGYHIIRVESVGTPTVDQLSIQIKAALAEQGSQETSPLSTWLQATVVDADVTVNSRFGTWDAEKFVVPPESASTQTTVVPETDSSELIPTDSLVTEGG